VVVRVSALLVLLLVIAGAVTLWLVHRDGIEIGREQAMVERERALRNLNRLQDQNRKVGQ
jgi:hypothetical protein